MNLSRNRSLTDDAVHADQSSVPEFFTDYIEKFNELPPLSYPGANAVDKQWVATFMQRLHAGSFRPPEFLASSILPCADAKSIVSDAGLALQNLPNIIDVFVGHSSNAVVVGDLHGHLHDLLAIVNRFGWPRQECIYIFNGDYVDRGAWGVEVLLLLFVLKIVWPHFVHILKGNHEYPSMMKRFGFHAEVVTKYGTEMWNEFLETLRWVPLAAVISTFTKVMPDSLGYAAASNCIGLDRIQDEKDAAAEVWRLPLRPHERRILVVHGGVFPTYRRSQEPGMDGKFYGIKGLGVLESLANAERDLGRDPCGVVQYVVWSDPKPTGDDIEEHKVRGNGGLYGPGYVDMFLKENRLHGIIRAHECPAARRKRSGMGNLDQGWCVDMKFDDQRYLCTVFSSSDYPMYEPDGNQAAVATVCGAAKGNGHSLLPVFTSFEIPERPKDMHLFYRPK